MDNVGCLCMELVRSARDAFPCLVFYPHSDKTEGLDAGKGCQQLNFRKAGMRKRKLRGLKRLRQGV